jgi:nicotinamidase-related amidase
VFHRIKRMIKKRKKTITFDKKTVLIVVDMQDQSFEAAKCNTTTQNILKLIRLAKAADSLIVVLEYVGHHSTRSDIMAAITPHDNHRIAYKSTDGGGDEVKQFLTCQTHAVLCGVNYGACVFRTAHDLKDTMRVLVVRDACNQPEHWSTDMEGYTKKYKKEVGKNCIVQLN